MRLLATGLVGGRARMQTASVLNHKTRPPLKKVKSVGGTSRKEGEKRSKEKDWYTQCTDKLGAVSPAI